MFHTFHNVKISALRTAVPANEIRLEDEIHFYGGSVKKSQDFALRWAWTGAAFARRM